MGREQNYELKLYKELISDLELQAKRQGGSTWVSERIRTMRLKLEGYFNGLKESRQFDVIDQESESDFMIDDVSGKSLCKRLSVDCQPNPPKGQ